MTGWVAMLARETESQAGGHGVWWARRCAVLLLCFVASVLIGGLVRAAEPIRFAPLPVENRDLTVRTYLGLVAHLERQLGRPVTLLYFDRHDEVIDRFVAGQLDLAVVGPLPYVMMRRQQAATEPLVFFREPAGNTAYHCALIVAAGTPPRLADLRHKRIGLTQRMSTCGYLGANAILIKQAGFSLAKADYRYLGSHEKVVRAVAAGTVDVGVVKEEYARKYATLGLQVLALSEAVPPLTLVGNRATLGEATLKSIRQLLPATPAEVYRQWGGSIQHGMEAADDAAFAALRAFGDPEAIPPAPAGR